MLYAESKQPFVNIGETMAKVFCLAFAFCCFLASVSRAQAQQQFSITELVDVSFSIFDGQPPGPGISIGIPNGDGIVVRTPNLVSGNISVASDTRLFAVSSGDFLSNATINSFVNFVDFSSASIVDMSSVPFGESFLGFAVARDLTTFDTFGYAQVLRTPETLELLATDFVSAGIGVAPNGITVPTPEPSSALLGTLGLMAIALSRRRSW